MTTYKEMTIYKGHYVCSNCKHKLHGHDRERVRYDNGTYGYDYVCPEESREWTESIRDKLNL